MFSDHRVGWEGGACYQSETAFDCAEFHRQQNSPIIPSRLRDLWQARAAQAFKNVNKIRGIYSAVEWDEPDMRTTESRHHTTPHTKVEAAPVASEWSLFKTLLVRRISTWLLWPGGNTDLFVTNRLILNQNSFSFTRQNIHKLYQTMRQAFDKSVLHSTKNVLVILIASRTTPSETSR